MSGRRGRSGQGRMDAAVDHFAPMGYSKADVRKVINHLLKNVYGKKGWLLLEDNCYHVVQEALFEKQEQEEKLNLQQQEAEHVQEQEEREEDHQDEDLHVQEDQQQQQEEWEEDDEDEDRQQEAANLMGAPSGNDMPVVEAQDEMPCEAEELPPMIIDPPAHKAASPYPVAAGSRTRRPCYGWISESESDSDYEEFLASGNSGCISRVQEETFLKGSGSVGGL